MIQLDNTLAQAEYSIIGAICIDQRIVPKIAPKLSESDFTISACAKVYEAAVDATERGKAFDAVIAADVLSRTMDKQTATQFIVECMDVTPTVANAEIHAEMVHKYACARNLKNSVMEAVMCNIENPQDVAGDIIGICQDFLNGENSGKSKSMAQALTQMYEVKKSKTGRIDTGFPRLDGLLKGMHSGNLIIIGARPGVGKSAMAIDIAKTAATYGNKTLFYSMEMEADEVAERLVARCGTLTMDSLIDNELSADDWKKIGETSARVSRLPIIINDEACMTVSKIRAEAVTIKDLKLIVIDYIQLMQTTKKYDSRNLEVGAISRALKILAKELKIPIVVLSQLNREKGENDKPELRDLRESGELEQHANKVLFIWRIEDLPDGAVKVGVSVAKNRRGKAGVVVMRFDGSHMMFTETQENYTGKRKSKVFDDD